MSLDLPDLKAAFQAHTSGKSTFTRRMAISMADMDGTTPRRIVLRLEAEGLLKPGAWDWFAHHGGITPEQVAEARAGRTQAERAPGEERDHG